MSVLFTRSLGFSVKWIEWITLDWTSIKQNIKIWSLVIKPYNSESNSKISNFLFLAIWSQLEFYFDEYPTWTCHKYAWKMYDRFRLHQRSALSLQNKTMPCPICRSSAKKSQKASSSWNGDGAVNTLILRAPAPTASWILCIQEPERPLFSELLHGFFRTSFSHFI